MGVRLFNGGTRAFRTRDERSLLVLLDDSSASVLTNFLTTVLISVVTDEDSFEWLECLGCSIVRANARCRLLRFYLSWLIKLLASFAQFLSTLSFH